MPHLILPVDSKVALSAPITLLLQKALEGDREAQNSLFRCIFGELRRIAAQRLHHDRLKGELCPTELVNEAYIKLFGRPELVFENRYHFLAKASEAMRCHLVDLWRKQNAIKNNWGQRVLWEDGIGIARRWDPDVGLLADQLLSRLAEFDPRAAKVVELRMFFQLPDEQIAKVVGVGTRTVKRDYKAGMAWMEAAAKGRLDKSAAAGGET
jgi:RNA polymerase sigma factor (TIGR02999 family)